MCVIVSVNMSGWAKERSQAPLFDQSTNFALEREKFGASPEITIHPNRYTVDVLETLKLAKNATFTTGTKN